MKIWKNSYVQDITSYPVPRYQRQREVQRLQERVAAQREQQHRSSPDTDQPGSSGGSKGKNQQIFQFVTIYIYDPITRPFGPSVLTGNDNKLLLGAQFLKIIIQFSTNQRGVPYPFSTSLLRSLIHHFEQLLLGYQFQYYKPED